MADFEGFDGQTTEQPSKEQFWARAGVDAQPAPGNGSLPPGHDTFRVNERKGGKTTAAFVRTVN
jgi:hypothetical protein